MVLGHDPRLRPGRVATVGNSAGDGARIALLNKNEREDARRLARWTQLHRHRAGAAFQDAFVEAMPLPHAVDAFPHMAEIIDGRVARSVPPGASEVSRM